MAPPQRGTGRPKLLCSCCQAGKPLGMAPLGQARDQGLGGGVILLPPLFQPPLKHHSPCWAPHAQGIPGEGAGKQVFVNSSCHMREKHQATSSPAA